MKKVVITVFGICGYSVFMEVDNFHKTGETIFAKQIHEEIGAKGFNQALTAARQNADVNFIFALADDYYSKKIAKDAKKYPINYYIANKVGRSPFACILTNNAGHNQVTVYPGVKLEVKDFSTSKYEKLIKESDVVLLQLEIPNEINFEIINLCKKHNVKVILNPAPAVNFTNEYLDDEILLTPNEAEALDILALDHFKEDSSIIKACFKKGIKRLVVTLGANGALVYDETIKRIMAPAVNVVDTTGAGDIFNGVLAYNIACGATLYDATVLAVKAASSSVLKKHVLEAIPVSKIKK